MFSSIKWKFVLVYFLLVFIAMAIIGIFIIGRLEEQQIQNVTDNMEQHIETIINTSSDLATDDWIANREEIQSIINEGRPGSTETIYVIFDEDVPTIIATSTKQYEELVGENALFQNFIDPTIVLEAFSGEKGESVVKGINDNTPYKHLAYPVYSSVGKINGVIYMTSNLENVYNTVNDSKGILTSATILALVITILLGFLIASSITVPIRDVTKKAEKMAMGDFDQYVDVKSDDEIGQLASMFNHLTLKLKETIQDMDLERSKLNTIFNYMAEGVIAIDTNGSIIHANPTAMEILGLEEDDLKDEKCIDLKSLNINRINYNDISSLEGTELSVINSQVFKVKYAPYKNETNIIAGLIVVFQDITQEHKLDNMRKEFVANVSHELKTPITTIKSYTETLMENDVDKELYLKFLSVIDTESDRMARLVRDLLQLSNIDYKKATWKKTEVSLNKMLDEIIQKLDLVIKEKEHKLKLNIQKNLPSILVDRDGIEQVILNIISNAIKYTENRGIIEITAYNTETDMILKVKDNGIGIPIEDQERIFERFYRVEKGRSREMGGTGLGLSIAKEIAEAHNGSISLESIPKEGTEITLRLPLV
ncbi:ATP-binding protein [Tissierella sp. Yu-01]|uniref:sensor histidine kinase n=1 Tax=Tissierella sp. Yu-01 TaxID=3035694 RepID=UPI00240DF776|nr:ATP-binding protein [Tissierella sp. Yu-01]WFA08297.1 ATP-binding protein [Tissierella sp. Yu-01]